MLDKIQSLQLLGIYQASLLIIGAVVGLGLLLIMLLSIRARLSRLGGNEANLSGSVYPYFLLIIAVQARRPQGLNISDGLVYCAVMLLPQLLIGVWSGLELSLICDEPPLI